jgi:hypothetical protein
MAVSLFEVPLRLGGASLGLSIGVHGFAILSCKGENGFVGRVNYVVATARHDIFRGQAFPVGAAPNVMSRPRLREDDSCHVQEVQ